MHWGGGQKSPNFRDVIYLLGQEINVRPVSFVGPDVERLLTFVLLPSLKLFHTLHLNLKILTFRTRVLCFAAR